MLEDRIVWTVAVARCGINLVPDRTEYPLHISQFYEADTLDHVGDTHQAMGDNDGAREAWQTAASILDELEHRRAAEIRAKAAAI